jgi:NTP pyrophosphatase (non-canonical NTP hydrolase)
MTFEEYTAAVMRTAPPAHAPGLLANLALGVAGEAGEVADLIKKQIFHPHDPEPDRLIAELGDVLWYVAALASTLSVPLEEVARRNVAKLQARYPAGFDPARSRERP